MRFHCHLKEADGKGKRVPGGADANGVAEEMLSPGTQAAGCLDAS